MGSLTIGQLAKQTDIGLETIRFYEREGLIENPPRRPSGYHSYPPETVQRVRFIRVAKELGFSLKEIGELLDLRVNPVKSCAHVKTIAEDKITDIEQRIRTRGRPVKIDILYFDGCPNHDLADQRVREVLDELGVQAEVVHVNVKDENTAQEVQFPGSPTIRVNGADVDPGTSGGPFSMRCRVYPTSSGFDGAPDKDAIRAAIERSAA